MDLKEKVIEIFEEVLESDEIRDNEDLDLFENELLDSLAIIEVLLMIEEKLGISLQPTDLERKDMSSVNNLVNFLRDRV
ncbi:D-alanine--poly(phosphoribitol) ligase subunit 2 [Peptostreptococcus canis]|uniref:D-alanyl carrier protein n=1 Tax=Peptostreptococcus canis TaxID=1159213 RepID=A0ABR6TK73_9FIRM|nr:D-alanine--poly(phosphoribitol) ligase subunit 2 [Peptostreptococcus canis]MBC2575802.1 D-alanine--poly(phosphoribitol) ligase subunit 2 [Peptostreptococcus canis]MBP1998083.1 D-alanine--poly(phosphoribitol) ligase subunit 2 [Peptostreptococcus canis]